MASRYGRIRLWIYLLIFLLLLLWAGYRWLEGPRGTVEHGTGHDNPGAYGACVAAAEAAFGPPWRADPPDSASVATGTTLMGPVEAAVLVPVRHPESGAVRAVECRLEPVEDGWRVRSLDVRAD